MPNMERLQNGSVLQTRRDAGDIWNSCKCVYSNEYDVYTFDKNSANNTISLPVFILYQVNSTDNETQRYVFLSDSQLYNCHNNTCSEWRYYSNRYTPTPSLNHESITRACVTRIVHLVLQHSIHKFYCNDINKHLDTITLQHNINEWRFAIIEDMTHRICTGQMELHDAEINTFFC